MSLRFIHVADIHLGYRQYASDTRENDFARAWFWVCDYAVEQHPDFLLIAGDLFNSGSVAPVTLLQAVDGLERLRKARIPVFAIEGNHDRARLADSMSWQQYLRSRELLYLLHADVDGDRIELADGEAQGAHITGVQYVGASTPKVLAMLDQSLFSETEYTVLMLHGGLEEAHHFGASFGMDDLNALRHSVDYVALGHIHQFYEREEWVWNPGSPESCSVDEFEQERYILEVQVSEDPRITNVTKIMVPCRDFWRPQVDVSDCGSAQMVADAILECLDECESSWEDNPERIRPPVIEVTLTGTLQFPRTVLDLEAVKALIHRQQEALLVRIANKTTSVEAGMNIDPDCSREEIECRAITDVFMADARYAPHADRWVGVTVEAKEMSLTGHDAEAIAGRIREVAT